MKINIKNILYGGLLLKFLKLSSVSIIANFFGFLIPVFIAYKYRISKQTDDFFLSYSIVLFVGGIFAGSVRTVIIPFLKEKLNDILGYNKFISSVFFFSTKLLILLCIVLFVLTGSIFLATDKLFYLYLFLSVPILYFSVINSFFYGILNSLDQFYVAELSPISRAIIIFLMIYFYSGTLGMSAVIIGYNLGEIGKFFHLLYIIKIKNKLIISRKYNNYTEIKSFLKQGLYQIMSVAISASAPMVDRVVASFLVVGAVSVLDYGDKIVTVFIVVINSFLTLILSKWSADAVKKAFQISKLHKAMLMMFISSSIVFIIIFIFKIQIVKIIYPKISQQNRNLIASLLLINMMGFIFGSLNQVINRAIIVSRFSAIMITTSIYRFVFNLIFDVIFALIWGVIGIVYSSLLVQIIGFYATYYLFKKRHLKSHVDEQQLALNFGKRI